MCSGRVYHNYVFQSCLIYINNNQIYYMRVYLIHVIVASFWGVGGRMRVRGIALLCVQMMNHHTFRREKIAMQLNRVANKA